MSAVLEQCVLIHKHQYTVTSRTLHRCDTVCSVDSHTPTAQVLLYYILHIRRAHVVRLVQCLLEEQDIARHRDQR